MTFDLVIVGAGPAGITAGIYAARKKINFLLISQDVGGQTLWSADVENYTGYQFITGAELVAKFEEHLKQFKVQLKKDQEVTQVCQLPGNKFCVKTAKETHEARSVILACGRRPRWLDVKGAEEFRNKGISYCATCDGPIFAGKTVAVVGGGNAALDAALQMIQIAEKIYLVNINPALAGDAIMLEKVEKSPKVEILNETTTQEIVGDQFVKGIKVAERGKPRDLAVEGVFVEIGSVPNSHIVDFVAKNDAGEIIVDNLNRTSVPGVFAAGDVTNVPEKQIIVAAGEGAKSVLGVFRYLSQSEDK
ncbi:MAG: FAD-dependent oxidoreductase [Candidatus Omnitrophota bacterium]